MQPTSPNSPSNPLLTAAQLKVAMPNASADNIAKYVVPLNATMQKHSINTPLRMAQFLAQVAYESWGLLFSEEIASGAAYEGRKDLGNIMPGDGERYKGRGLIQLTGRANYAAFAKATGLDVVTNPDLVSSEPILAAETAGWYWGTHNLNVLADKDDALSITRSVNGGTNGLAGRLECLSCCKDALGCVVEPTQPTPVPKPQPQPQVQAQRQPAPPPPPPAVQPPAPAPVPAPPPAVVAAAPPAAPQMATVTVNEALLEEAKPLPRQVNFLAAKPIASQPPAPPPPQPQVQPQPIVSQIVYQPATVSPNSAALPKPKQVTAQSLAEAMVAQQRAVAFHLYDPNVSLIDVGWRIKEGAGNRIDAGDLRVRVHVKKKMPLASIPAFRRIDPARIGHATDVIESTYQLHAAAAASPQQVELLPRTARVRPLQGGASGDRYDPSATAATLGGFVKDRQNGAIMILSNYHVIAGTIAATPGLPTLQPSPMDGGSGTDVVATYTRDAMQASMDAAVATLADGVQFVNDQLGIGPVTGLSAPTLGMIVTKSGRMTGVTLGMIDGVAGVSLPMSYGGYPTVIRNVCHIVPAPPLNGPVSDGGDSGSWWLEQATNRAVALHFAGTGADADEDYALAITMSAILDSLNVDLAL